LWCSVPQTARCWLSSIVHLKRNLQCLASNAAISSIPELEEDLESARISRTFQLALLRWWMVSMSVTFIQHPLPSSIVILALLSSCVIVLRVHVPDSLPVVRMQSQNWKSVPCAFDMRQKQSWTARRAAARAGSPSSFSTPDSR
jgi:hypothetical protein